jgi:hypothetical protein
MDTNKIQTISDIQEAIADKMRENVFFVQHNVPILVENSKTIDFDIRTSMSKLGICATVSTPSLSFQGHYGAENRPPFWMMETATVVVVENPVLNRGRANYATALDTALQVAQTLNTSLNFGLTSIQQTSEQGLVIVTVQFKTDVAFQYGIETMTQNG